MRLIFLDTETPNQKNDRICQIGIVVTEGDNIVFEHCWLVNPETRFDERTMQVHSISKSEIVDSPVFPVVWKEILEWMTEDTILVMHHALFDLNVIQKTLTAYHEPMPVVRYMCTMRKATKSRQFSSSKLDKIAMKLDFKFHHHNALSDAEACRFVYLHLKSSMGWNDNDVYTYCTDNACCDIESYGTDFYHAVKELQGIVMGIASDGIIQDEEIEDLKRWMLENECQRQKLGFESCLNMLESMISQRRLNIQTCQEIYKWLFQREEKCHVDTYALEEWHGILRGIAADGILMRSELEFLIEWMENHNWIDSNADDIYEACVDALAMLSSDSDQLCPAVNQRIMTIIESELSDDNLNDIGIELSGAVCCLTGTFESGRKNVIEARIEKAGGICASGVTKNTRYVFIGGEGSQSYKCGNHGSKVSKALEYKAKGQLIDVYEEKLLIDALNKLEV